VNQKDQLWFSTDIADIRFCFACGSALSLRRIPLDRRKRLVCGACHHVTYLNPKSVAGLIPVMPDGRIVLLQREIQPARGRWSYPAGYQELGETVRHAAARETWEEICVRPKVGRLLDIYSYKESGVITSVFVGGVPRGQKPAPGVESQSVALFEPKKIPWKKLAFPSTVDALRDYVESL
jgi:ADP-ribose pyrophosphatase YjhB (NUDIX family)